MISPLSPTTALFLNGISRLQSLITTTTTQLTSGYSINQPSDAPDQISPLLQLQANLGHNQTVLENLTSVQTKVSSADQAMSSAILLLEDATTLGAQGASSNVTASTRADLAEQVASLQQQMVSLSDTQVSGQYVFSGDQDAAPPYASGPTPTVIGSAKANLINPGENAAFTIQTASGQTSFTITGQTGDTLQTQLTELNTNLASLGITASTDSTGKLQFQSASAFSVSAVASPNPNLVDTTADTVDNTGLNTYSFAGQAPGSGGGNDVQITVGGINVIATLPDGLGTADKPNVDAINAALQAAGVTSVTAVIDLTQANAISFQGASNFSIADDSAVAGTYAPDGSSTGTALNGVDRLISQQTTTRLVDLSDHTSTPVDQTAQDLFDHRNADGSLASDNVFAALNSLRIALANNDSSAITSAQATLKTASQYLNSKEVFYGATTNRLSAAVTQLNTENVNLQQQISTIRDVDTVQAALTLTAAETQNQAALEAEAKLPHTSLFDFLG